MTVKLFQYTQTKDISLERAIKEVKQSYLNHTRAIF
ncbi:Uncharacterised protein [Staphylococcus aureus]|uniref:Uncharacterized protein n=1 Tax=Staphylococcus aureus TaxID=1280 RepID=A0A380DWD7_STAAU|nr:Uncharacterised protein [Staphylococcus aureus]